MRDYGQKRDGNSFSMQTVLRILRAVSAVLGIIAIIIGLMYATQMFTLLFSALQEPDSIHTYLEKWTEAVGGEELDIVIDGTTYPCANAIAITVLGGIVVCLAWISMGLILTGAKVVSWTLSDREAIKKILSHAFGAERKPKPDKSSESNEF
jgi:hypothetical protein